MPLTRTIEQGDFAAEHLGNNTHFLTALGETSEVDQAVGDYLAGSNRGDACDWYEHATTSGDFYQDARGLRCARFAVAHKNVDDFTYSITGRVKDATARQTGNKNSGCAHRLTLDAGGLGHGRMGA